ncbi:MAG TPA: hypothetical protein VL100_13495 [Croceibacterium sp.]|nr:hypothetical protein [Croceibacterium sp.]
MKLFRSLSYGAALILGASAMPAAAQLEEYKDYEVSDAVWQMTTVRIDQGQFETYLEGLKSTWVGANKVAKKLGQIEDYAIYVNEAPAPGAFDLVLMIKIPSTAMMGPSKKRYDDFLEAYGKANIDKGNDTVIKLYNEIREIQGTYLLREVTVK